MEGRGNARIAPRLVVATADGGAAAHYHRSHRSTSATRNPPMPTLRPARPTARHALPVACSLAALVAALAAPLTAGAQATGAVKYDLDDVIIHPVHAMHGMVSSESALASDVGVEVLRQGGNAVDAAVAVGFALAVTMPNSGNIGGGGFMILHDGRTGKDTAIDFREMAPAAATRNMYLDEQGNVVKGKSLFTQAAIGVPGTVAGLTYALEHYGTMKRERLVAPAVRLARQGFPVGETLAGLFAGEREHLNAWDGTRKVFFHDGKVPVTGDILRNPDLARSLSLIGRDGAKAFYDGPIGAGIVAEAKAHGGLITAADLKNYKVVERVPVRGTYRGYEITGPPPPSSGGVHVIEMLNILEGYDIAALGFGSPDALHLVAEALKIAFADRAAATADPAFVAVPVAALIDKGYAAERRARIDMARAQSWGAGVAAGESPNTTHVTIADGAGNIVASTQTINSLFGAHFMVPGTGIVPNNYMYLFDPHPGKALSIAPGKRITTSMSPLMALRDGKPVFALGLPGGLRIFGSAMQALVNLIDHGMSLQEAVEAPRLWTQGGPVEIEDGFPEPVRAALRTRGHDIAVMPHVAGGMSAIRFEEDGTLTGAACWRADGTPIGIAGGLARKNVRFWPDRARG
jgi:gamma-glutamyltranspeptidase / glutathione hydrolase